jgi:hypothetical protein
LRDVEKEQEQIYNGNRYFFNTEEMTGVFHRDVDKLMFQYRNLRLSVYNQYKDYLPDPISQSELRSYIDEQFIRLVKEYDINGPVDFPGYIKTKLNYRTKHSFIKGAYRDRQRVFVPKNEFDVTNLIEQNPFRDEELDYYETLEYALNDMDFSTLEKEILFYILQEMTDAQIEKKVKKNHPDEKISSAVIKETLKAMQIFLKTKLKESLEL